MKSRMKKLLAAALALCLIAAMVPGAALAASTPTGNFSTVNKNQVEKTAYHDTLAEAVEYASKFNDDQYKVITVEVDNAEVSGTLSSGITLKAEGKNLVVTGDLTIYGTVEDAGDIDANHDVTVSSGGSLELNGTMNIARGKTATINGTLEGSGTIVAASDPNGTKGGTLSATGDISNSIDISVGEYAEVTLPSNYELGGTLSVAEYATAKVYGGTLDVTGAVTIAENGTVDSGVTVSDTGDVTVSGKIDGTVTINKSASLTLIGDEASVGDVEVNGTLTVNDTYNFSSGSTLTGDGTLKVSSGAEVTLASGYSFGGEIEVADGATLNVGTSEKVGSASINGDAVLSKDGSTTVITVGEATVSNDVTIGSGEKLVVSGELTLNADMTIETGGGLVVNGTVNINSNRSLTTNTAMSGSGTIYVTGELYNNNSSPAGAVKIQIVSGGLVYSKSTDLGGNIQNGETTGGGNNYSAVWQLGEGSSYDIAVVHGNNGDVINPPKSATSGKQVTITADPDTGYMVDPANTYYMVGGQRYDSIGVNNNVCTFVMPENDVTVHINFKKAENSSTTTEGNITVVTNHNGNGTVNASINGRVVTVTVRANTNYVINTVSIAGRGQTVATDAKSGTYSYTVPGTGNATVEVYVTFKSDDFEVTLTNYTYDDGRISLSSGTTTTGRYAEGQRVYIYAYPDRDFYVRSLTITRTDNRQTVNYYESSSSDDVFYFDMPASDVTVRAYFTDGVYEIATDIDGSGRLTITGEDGNVTDVAEEGEEIRITASPSNNYRLGDLYVTYTDSDDEDQVIYPEVEYKNNGNVDYYWFEMPEYDVEIYADFGEGDYVAWIDRSDMKNGTIRVSPNVADEDDTVSIYVTPDTGYQLDELIVEDEDGHDVTTSSLASGTRYTFRMPDSDVTVTATFKSRSYSSNFTDVPRYEWYYEAVSYVASEGLMNGVSTTQFNPNGTASRAQIVTILWRLAGEPSALTGAFTDVPAGQYYSTAVAWASRQGIVTGVGNNRFEPNSNITREQLAVILYRYAQDAGYTTSASANITGYYDYARVNSYARTAMSWAVGAGLITGTSTTTLSPQDTATRAQVATILMRFCENIAK